MSPTGVRRIEFGPLPRERHTDPLEQWPDYLGEAVEQLEAYFAKRRTTFDVQLDFSTATTGFQHDVYRRLLDTEYGQVVSYGQVARDVGKPDMARAVGQAVGGNPIPIVVPCHRVVRSDGRLGGYSGGLRRKVALLAIEGINVDGYESGSKVHPELLRLPL